MPGHVPAVDILKSSHQGPPSKITGPIVNVVDRNRFASVIDYRKVEYDFAHPQQQQLLVAAEAKRRRRRHYGLCSTEQ